MKSLPSSSSLELLRLVEQDVTALRTARQSLHRKQRQNFSAPPSRLDEARQAGMEEGLLLALQIINKRMHLESAIYQPGLSRSLIDARLKLQAAEVAFSLSEHGAQAPLTSAAYGAYVQAYKVLDQARAHYKRVATNESGKPGIRDPEVDRAGAAAPTPQPRRSSVR